MDPICQTAFQTQLQIQQSVRMVGIAGSDRWRGAAAHRIAVMQVAIREGHADSRVCGAGESVVGDQVDRVEPEEA